MTDPVPIDQPPDDIALHRSRRLESLGQLTGGIAHDFNNLLSIVLGNLDLLRDRVAQDAAARALVDETLMAATHGADLTRRLLAFARQQPLEPRSIQIDRVVEDFLPILRRTIGEAITVSVAQPPALWPALADPAQVEDALLNLAINARDAMPVGGTLGIETRNIVIDDTAARAMSDGVAGDYVVLSVSDTGTGMSAEIVDRAVDPFFTTKAPGQGTGLGLSIVYGFTKQSGGHLKIYSERGLGTTVRIYLPRAPDPDDRSTPTSAEGAVPGGSETILMVEDNAAVRKIASRILTELGYRVLLCETAAEAIKIIESPEPIDLLFTDVIMPGGLTGLDLAAITRYRRPGTPVLFTSGYSAPLGTRAGDLPPGDILVKPYRRDEIAARIRTALAQPRLPIPR